MEYQYARRAGFGERCKVFYVETLLRLLPTLINLVRHVSSKVRHETDYLGDGFTFQLKIQNSPVECVCRIDRAGKMRRVAPALRATDVEFGSGLPSNDQAAVTVDYVIAFQSVDYAFRCFSGGMSLKEALAQRAFATRGPNDAGVALTYMFTALLRMFFFWRRPYRKGKAPEPN